MAPKKSPDTNGYLLYKIAAGAFGTLVMYLAVKMDNKVEKMEEKINTVQIQLISVNKYLEAISVEQIRFNRIKE